VPAPSQLPANATQQLIPPTGVDFAFSGELLYYQRIFVGLGFALLGLGMVFRGIAGRLASDDRRHDWKI
jgi:hypothetical protein